MRTLVSQRRSLRARASGLALSGNLGRARTGMPLCGPGRDSPGAGWPFPAPGGHMGGQHPPPTGTVTGHCQPECRRNTAAAGPGVAVWVHQSQSPSRRDSRARPIATVTAVADRGTRGASGRRAETAGVASATGTGVPTDAGRGLSGCEFRSLVSTRTRNLKPIELRQWHRGQKAVRDARLYFGREPRLHGHRRVLLRDPGLDDVGERGPQ